jgi:hypothetical protein
MCERKHSTQYRVDVYQGGQFLGSSYHWDKPAANRTYDKQVRKMDTTVSMYSPEGKKIRG